MINLTIPGEPVAKGRPRVCKFGTFTPLKSLNYETLVKELFIISKQKKETGMLEAVIKCYFKIPKSATKGKLLAMQHNIVRPVKRPDTDNLAKICLDALNGLAYDDDSQVVDLVVRKYWSEIPRVEIQIAEVKLND